MIEKLGFTKSPFFLFLKLFWKELNLSRVLDGAACLSFYFLFSILPSFIFIVALFSYLPQDVNVLEEQVFSYLPKPILEMFEKILKDVKGQKDVSLLSTGFFLATWSSSSGIAAIVRQLNYIQGTKESRNILKLRLRCILIFTFLVGLCFLPILVYFVGTMFLNYLPEFLSRIIYFILDSIWVKYLLLEIILLLMFGIIYYFGPDIKQRFKFITPGSLVGSLVLLILSGMFEVFIEDWSSYRESYSILGSAIILSIWQYLLGLLFIVGGQINFVVKKMSNNIVVKT